MTDYSEYKKLYLLCFTEDTEEDAELLFKNVLSKAIMISENNEEGQPIAMLFLMDASIVENGTSSNYYYLYAACTLKKFRGRGMMSDMLDFSKNIAYERNRHFIALKPAEESLYNYYSRFGYQSVFTKKKFCFKNKELIESELIVESISCFKWNKNSVDFAIKHHEYYGGLSVQDSDGYLLYTVKDNKIFIKENTFSVEKFLNIINDLSVKNKTEIISAELPYYFPLKCDNTERIKSGMLLPVSKKSEILIESIDNANLSLTLD